MCKGYTRDEAKASVGKGWRPLLDALYDWMYLNTAPASQQRDVRITQVKEKYGRLTIYASGSGVDMLFEGKLDGLEMASSVICEACGAPGKTRAARPWMLTLCDACHAKPAEDLREDL
jgi:hypothetical protein